MARKASPITIKQWKGLNLAADFSSIGDEELSTLTNFVIGDNGTLLKRRGMQRVTNTKHVAGTACRLLCLLRTNISGDFLYFTDNNKLYRGDMPLTTVQEILLGGISIPGVTWAFEYGSAAVPYQLQVVRSNAANFGVPYNSTVAAVGGSPAATFGIVFKERMFVFNTISITGTESNLYYSNIADFGVAAWPGTNVVSVSPGDGQMLTSAVVYNDTLILFKDRSTYVLNADGATSSWTLRVLHQSIGCIGRGTPQLIGGFIYFVSAEGVYRTDGTSFEEISAPIMDVFTTRAYTSASTLLDLDAIFWDNKYIISGIVANTLYAYDVLSETWSRWDFVGGVDPHGLATYSEANPDSFYTGGLTSGLVYVTGPSYYTDNGVAGSGGTKYTCTAVTKQTDFGDPVKYKLVTEVDVDLAKTSALATDAVLLQLDTDEVNTIIPTGVLPSPATRTIARYKGAGRCRFLVTTLTFTGSTSLEVLGISWYVAPVGKVGRAH